jgi:act minimal PKS acyl carrier protein
MSTFTIDDLARIMRQCAGEVDGAELTEDVATVGFADLGYDSLALLETASLVAREFGATLPDDVAASVASPAEFCALVNAALAKVA